MYFIGVTIVGLYLEKSLLNQKIFDLLIYSHLYWDFEYKVEMQILPQLKDKHLL